MEAMGRMLISCRCARVLSANVHLGNEPQIPSDRLDALPLNRDSMKERKANAHVPQDQVASCEQFPPIAVIALSRRVASRRVRRVQQYRGRTDTAY